MAVTLTELGAALRITDGTAAPVEPQLGILTRQLGAAEAYIDAIAPDAPDAVKDEAVVRFVAYMFDAPTAGRRDSYSAMYRNSGAASLLSPFISRRAGIYGVS